MCNHVLLWPRNRCIRTCKSNDRKLIHLILIMTHYHDETIPLPKHDTAFYRQSHASSYVIEREIEEKKGRGLLHGRPASSLRRTSGGIILLGRLRLTSCLRAAKGAVRFFFSDAAQVHVVCPVVVTRVAGLCGMWLIAAAALTRRNSDAGRPGRARPVRGDTQLSRGFPVSRRDGDGEAVRTGAPLLGEYTLSAPEVTSRLPCFKSRCILNHVCLLYVCHALPGGLV